MFSVIIPLYNKAETVERAIRSVLAQTEQNFELIVVDDGSKDNGAELVQKFSDPRIRLIQQPNGGVSAARNTGIAAATNEYITFLDADDEYLPDFLATIRDLIRDFPQAEIWGTDYWKIFPDGEKKQPVIRGLNKNHRGMISDYFFVAAQSDPIFCSISICIRKKALQKVGCFPLGIKSGEDLLTWARICAHGPAAYTAVPLANYYQEEIANYRPTRVPQKGNFVGKELINLLQKYRSRSLRKYIVLWQKNRISCFTRLNMRKEALGDCLKSLQYWPFEKKIYFYIFLNLMPQIVVHFIMTRSKQ